MRSSVVGTSCKCRSTQEVSWLVINCSSITSVTAEGAVLCRIRPSGYTAKHDRIGMRDDMQSHLRRCAAVNGHAHCRVSQRQLATAESEPGRGETSIDRHAYNSIVEIKCSRSEDVVANPYCSGRSGSREVRLRSDSWSR